jgi:hypothetical protein
MAATLTSPQVGMNITGNLSAGTFPTRTANPSHPITSTPNVGATAGSVNKLYQASFTIVNNATPTAIDLTSLTDIDGTTINLANVYAIEISNDSPNTGEDITHGGGTNGLYTVSPNVLPGGIAGGGALDPSGIIIKYGTIGKTVDATHKILTLATAAGTNVPGRITILGRQ